MSVFMASTTSLVGELLTLLRHIRNLRRSEEETGSRTSLGVRHDGRKMLC